MSRPERRASGGVSRADVLALLAVGPVDWVSQGHTDAQLIPGYERQPRDEAPEHPELPPHLLDRRLPKRPLQPTASLTPLQQPWLWVMTEFERPDADEAEASSPSSSSTPSPKPEALRPSVEQADEAASGLPPVSPWVRLGAGLQRHVSVLNPVGRVWVDWPRLLRRLASTGWPWPLPRQTRPQWPSDWVVVLDRNATALQPWVKDMDALAGQVSRQHGKAGLSVRVVAPGGPLQPWRPWSGWMTAGEWMKRRRTATAWAAPAPGTVMLVVSDMGLLTPQDTPRWEAWQHWSRTMQRAGALLVPLLPLPGQAVPGLPVHQPVPWVAWPEGALRVRRARPLAGPPGRETLPDDPAVHTLLAMVAVVGRVYPELLRALRLGLPSVAANQPVWELRVWNHPDVQHSEGACEIRPEQLPRWAGAARDLPVSVWRHVLEIRRLFQAGLPGLDEHLQVLRSASMAPSAVQDELAQPVAQACQALRHVAQGAGGLAQSVAALQCVWLATPAMRAAYPDVFAGLYRQAYRASLARGEAAPAVPGLVLGADESAPSAQGEPRLQLVLRPGGEVRLEDAAAKGVRWPLGPAVPGRVFWLRAGEAVWQFAAGDVAAGRGVPLASGVTRMELVSDTSRAVWAPLQRPRWAQSWGGRVADDGQGEWFAHSRGLDGNAVPLVWRGDVFPGRWQGRPTLLAGQAGRVGWWLGADEVGLWADLDVGRVVQRFRWIEPGSFLMGSPETEPGRDSDEGPQHRVTLTQGFWLADTACTQALWLAVVGGKNPSHFKGNDELPVEQVSWDDVMKEFMPKLQALLPEGVEATLPSEAQWEYACRAGTSTAYVWGDEMNPELANIDTRQTTPVKTYPANPWGLFDMHGNVFEWCFDGRRVYAEGETVDPLGAVGDGPRVLRGGSWNGDARNARSAYRYEGDRGGRWRHFGFRLALRFKPSEGAEPQGIGAGGPGVQRPEASQAEPGALRRGGATTPAQAEPKPDGREAAARKNGVLDLSAKTGRKIKGKR